MSSLSPAGDHSSGDPVSNVLSAHPTRERGRIESARVYPERFVVLEKHHLSLCTREGRNPKFSRPPRFVAPGTCVRRCSK